MQLRPCIKKTKNILLQPLFCVLATRISGKTEWSNHETNIAEEEELLDRQRAIEIIKSARGFGSGLTNPTWLEIQSGL